MTKPVVVVTGACGTLGRSVIRYLSSGNILPIAVDIASSPAPDEATHAILGSDISDAFTARRVIDEIASKLGRLDGLVNVAGGFIWRTLAASEDGDWDAMMRLNMSTAVEITRAALPNLIAARGAIVNVGAFAAAGRAAAGMGAYAASKAAVAKLTESLADELKDEGVRVNAVLPAILDTPANRLAMPDADWTRWIAVEALAKVIAFLLSDDAGAVTGALVPVTGRL